MKTRLPGTIATLALILAAPAQAHEVAQPDYAAEAERIMAGMQATGVTAAVMIDGEVVYTGAFGKIEEGRPDPVTTDTLFPIASISKAFTTTALAMLVDEGKLSWDDPVRKYIPEFGMYDPWVSDHFTIKDALTHRSGLPLGAGDLVMWPDGNAKVPDVINALRHLRPTTGFRDGYAYDNLLYIVAGEVVARVAGESWQSFVTRRILEPVGMSACDADGTTIKPGMTIVRGHERAAGASKGVPIDPAMSFSPTVAAAGGIWCSGPEMMKWARVWLDGGVLPDGTRLISEEQKNMVWRGVTPVGSGIIHKTGGSTNLGMYALGWFVGDMEGTPVVQHSGGAPGVASNFILLPQKRIAVFASSNDYMATAGAWTRQIADKLIDGKQDSDAIAAAITANARQNEEARALVDQAIAPPADARRPSLPLDAYTGTYRDPWYGTVTITRQGKRLFLDMSRSKLLDGPLTPYDGDTFAAIWPDRTLKADAFVTFTVEGGQVTGIRMKAISEITDFSFDFHDLDLRRE